MGSRPGLGDSDRTLNGRNTVDVGVISTSLPAIDGNPMNDLEERRKRVHEMAGDAIDGISDVSAGLEDHASRKRSLLEGPDEFQIIRMDRARAKPR
jgi:hypothetical protein